MCGQSVETLSKKRGNKSMGFCLTGFMKWFIYENSSPVINKTLNSRTQKTDARVGLDVKVTAAV